MSGTPGSMVGKMPACSSRTTLPSGVDAPRAAAGIAVDGVAAPGDFVPLPGVAVRVFGAHWLGLLACAPLSYGHCSIGQSFPSQLDQCHDHFTR